ncbi:pentatricopeptide repeat-containing protein At1g08070, chloroplastic-like isoform X1 [Cucurbita pepo subsp. pepo]|uniref:pentatricopeptide repeat-containing protein At1g08070, chloroplastic-like isoform X1 n=2 Tax=Cucurbita pepo subsp. pepo TaxID=3664 RepID=UPI000C9DA1BB|nr:pentatricopeptide repeat-containing protein At1g08070, chloroplastic-like isoform X1 [Cucurbita pepo subsp. pepo]
MASIVACLPNISVTSITHLSQFPENPKSLILQKCKTPKDLRQVHAHLLKTRRLQDPTIAEAVLESAALLLPNSIDYALSIFNHMDKPESSAYNVMIRGLAFKQSSHNAVLLFKKMHENSVQHDKFTFSSVLKACSRMRALREGEQVHALILKFGFKSNEFVENTLIHMYANCGQVGVARQVFDGMSERATVAWNSMLSGYTKNGLWDEVVKLFRKMLELRIEFDDVTMISVLMACGRLADLELGELIGEYIVSKGLRRNSTLTTSLIDMYAKCGQVDTARKLFDEMDKRDVVAWSAMISGYAQADRCKEALDLFHEMQKANVDANEVTMVSVLYSCAVLGAYETGKWVHSYITRKKMKLTVSLGTQLIDFYAKCGYIDRSVEVFRAMPFANVFTWTALIQGLANNGEGKMALDFFALMRENNVKPNDVTFIAVLSACSHACLVDQGRHLFNSMRKGFDIEPRIEHYGCMVDILGRAGLLEEAYQFIVNMPIPPNAVVWRTLLASCKAHKSVQMAEKSFDHITLLEPAHSGDYILLSNTYALVGRVEDALRVRSLIKDKEIKKTPGCSLIELDGVVHEFFSEDGDHTHSKEIHDALDEMMKRIKSLGYVPNIEDARLEAEEEESKETSVSHHSEKLAIAYGLIRTPLQTTIRISKNLRMCRDCHNATKVISRVYKRTIIVRDRNRFHHFKDGVCSCNDYW